MRKEGKDTRFYVAVVGIVAVTAIFFGFLSFSDKGFSVQERDNLLGQATARPPVTLNSPIHNDVVEQDNFYFSWNKDQNPNIAHYVVSVCDAQGCGKKTHVNQDKISAQYNTKKYSLEPGDYKWWVKAIDNSGSTVLDWSETGKFSVVERKVTLLEPDNGETFLFFPSFVWEPVTDPNLANYVITICDAQGCGVKTHVDQEVLSAQQDTVDYDLPSGEYKWWVKAVDGSGNTISDWSDTGTFAVEKSKVSLLEPINGQIVTTRNHYLSWHHFDGPTANYVLTICDAQGCGVNTVAHQDKIPHTFNAKLYALEPGDYSWWVKSIDEFGKSISDWSDTGRFSVAATEDAQPTNNAQVLDIPIPKNPKCFYGSNFDLAECSDYYQNGMDPACPPYVNGVYDDAGIWYPSACWAEHFGKTSYTPGYSSQLQQFIKDIWMTRTMDQDQLKISSPNIGFTFAGSGYGDKSGTFFRSTLWENNQDFYILDYDIDTNLLEQQFSVDTISYRGKLSTQFPNSDRTAKTLITYVLFDELYPEQILHDWTKTYVPVINDYVKKKQQVSNPLRYDVTTVVIDPPSGIATPTAGYQFSDEEKQKIFDAATTKLGQSDFDTFVISPIVNNKDTGYFKRWNNMDFMVSSVSPSQPYSDTNKQDGLDALYDFQITMQTFHHELLHAQGLPGDHVLMNSDYYSLGSSDIDYETGKPTVGPKACDFVVSSSDFYSVDLPSNLHIKAGEVPGWLSELEGDSESCLKDDVDLIVHDADKDGNYEKIIYSNNIIAPQLQAFYGWTDIDNDGVIEIIDSNPYGGFEHITSDIVEGHDVVPYVQGPHSFTHNNEQTIGDCRFATIELDNGVVGNVPLECAAFDEDVINIYNDINYHWIVVENTQYGTVLLARKQSSQVNLGNDPVE